MSIDNFITKKDKNGNIVSVSNIDDNYSVWYEYDENNNMIHHFDSNGFEIWYDYDENGNIIHSKNIYGYEYDVIDGKRVEYVSYKIPILQQIFYFILATISIISICIIIGLIFIMIAFSIKAQGGLL